MGTELIKNSTTDEPADVRIVAEVIITSITVLFGIIVWALYRNLLFSLYATVDASNGTSELTVTFVTLLILTFILYLSLLAVFLIFSSKKTVYFGIPLLAITPLVLFTYSAGLFYVTSIGIVYVLMLLSSRVAMRRAYNNQIKFFLPNIIRIGMSIILLFILIFVSVLHFSVTEKRENVDLVIQESLIHYSIAGLNLFLNQFEGYHTDMTLDEFLLFAGAKGFIKGNLGDLTISNESTTDIVLEVKNIQSKIILEQQIFLREQFLSSFGIENSSITGTTPIREVWSEYARAKAKIHLTSNSRFLSAIVSIGLFLMLLFLSKFLKGLVYLSTWNIIGMLKLMKILQFKEEQITIKRLRT